MPLLNPSALDAFKASAGLLDGVFPSGAAPSSLPIDLKVAFGPSAVVALGNTLSVDKVASFPSTVAFVADPAELYTLVLADPDAPSASSPTSRSFLHCIKPNLRALGPDRLVELAQAGGDATDGEPSIVEVPKEDLMPWRAPGPGKGSGAHRYVWLLVSQPNGKLDLPAEHPLRNSEPEGRRRFNIETFAKDVLGGGQVVGANFFVVEAEP